VAPHDRADECRRFFELTFPNAGRYTIVTLL
jgi:hypothetical protein